jgi:predicted nucleic acid-binding protein
LIDIEIPSQARAEMRLAVICHNLGLLNALIAHTAIEHGLALQTFNAKHYAPITALTTNAPYTR